MAKIDRQAVYDYLTAIPFGSVVTYGMIGEYFGNKDLARAIGNILHKNPDSDKYPCYKVVNADGKLSLGYAFGGIEEQKRRLLAEGIEINGYKVDLKKYRWEY